MPDFSYRHEAVIAPAIPARIRFAAGNSLRRGLVIAASDAQAVWIFNSGGTANTGVIAIFLAPATLVMPFRDWGDIIQQEIWIGIAGGPLTVHAIEYFRIPQGER